MMDKNSHGTMIPGVIYTINLPKRRPTKRRKSKLNIGLLFGVLLAMAAAVLGISSAVAGDNVIHACPPEPYATVTRPVHVIPGMKDDGNLSAVEMVELRAYQRASTSVVKPKPIETVKKITPTPAPTPLPSVEPETIEMVETESTLERNTYALKYWANHDDGQPDGYNKSLGEFKITFYCACKKCCGKNPTDPAYGITASGKTVAEGTTIAVSRKQIPLGTSVYIEGLGTFEAQDTGGAIKTNRIDVYVADHNEALKCGVEKLQVYVQD